MEIKATQKDAYRLLHEGVLAFSRAERQGLRIDLEYCRKTQKKLTQQIKNLEKELFQTKFYKDWKKSLGGKRPNINSNSQLGDYLYKTKGIEPPKTTPTGQGSTDKESLTQLDIPEIKDLLRMRKLKKLRDTYLKGFMKEQVDGFIHPHFNLHRARTFRSSSSAPNFQNIPKRDSEAQEICRRALYPRKGFQLLEVDYSGIEVCISACYHKDPTMIKYIKDPESDMHGDMAKQIFGVENFDRTRKGHDMLRSAAKNGFVFPQFYGDYYGNNAYDLAIKWGELPEDRRWRKSDGVEIEDGYTLGEHLIKRNLQGLDSFTEHIKQIEDDFWGRRFRVYNEWKKSWYKQYKKDLYIEMLTGFRCHGPMSENDATNYPIQGTAFHCLLWSFIKMDKVLRAKKMKSRVIGQIHDSIVLDVHPKELDRVLSLLRTVMIDKLKQHWPWIIIPLDIDADLSPVDESWQEMEAYDF